MDFLHFNFFFKNLSQNLIIIHDLTCYIYQLFCPRFHYVFMVLNFVFMAFTWWQGMVLLTLSVSVIPLHYRKAIFFVALYILSLGEGGHKPCVQTFAADQFDEDSLEDKKAKSSFFNWWFLGIVAGSSSAILVVIYVEVKRILKLFGEFLLNLSTKSCKNNRCDFAPKFRCIKPQKLG